MEPTNPDELATYLPEPDDGKGLRRAFAVALVFHLALFLVHLPEGGASQVPEAEPDKVFIVQPVRFQPPPPEQQPEIPPPRARRVPVPDPTPDEPEPIRDLEAEPVPEMDVADLDLMVQLPDGPPPPPAPTGPLQVGGEVLAPVRVYDPPPAYTEAARRARIQGRVILEAIIEADGTVRDAEVLRGLPMGLDEAARQALLTWRFEPGTLHGEPVPVKYVLSVDFAIR